MSEVGCFSLDVNVENIRHEDDPVCDALDNRFFDRSNDTTKIQRRIADHDESFYNRRNCG